MGCIAQGGLSHVGSATCCLHQMLSVYLLSAANNHHRHHQHHHRHHTAMSLERKCEPSNRRASSITTNITSVDGFGKHVRLTTWWRERCLFRDQERGRHPVIRDGQRSNSSACVSTSTMHTSVSKCKSFFWNIYMDTIKYAFT